MARRVPKYASLLFQGNLLTQHGARCFCCEWALRNPAYGSGPKGGYGAGLELMRWNSVKKTAQWAVLCQLAYNHAIMDLRAYKETLNSLKTPMQGVFVVVLCTVAFVVWLGVLVVITKLLMG